MTWRERGTCVDCRAADELLYTTDDDHPRDVCAECYRQVARRIKRVQACDDCGDTPAWRDPITREDRFRCIKCHAASGTVFQNRWARASEDRVAQSLPISDRRDKCDVADNSCFGQVRPRQGRVLCDKHAGKPRR